MAALPVSSVLPSDPKQCVPEEATFCARTGHGADLLSIHKVADSSPIGIRALLYDRS